MPTPSDDSGADATHSSNERPSINPSYLAALDELDARLSEQGVHLRLYVHGAMTVAVAQREGNTTSTIEGVLADGSAILEELALEIADQRGLPPDWLARLSGAPDPTGRERRSTFPGRIRIAGIKRALQLVAACKRTTDNPGASKLRKRAALVGIRIAVLAIVVMRKLPADRNPGRRTGRARSCGRSPSQ